MRFRIICSCLVLQGVVADSSAQAVAPKDDVTEAAQPAQPATAVASVDYGPAFERLIKLGLPDTKGASYVKLTVHGKGAQEVEAMRYQQGGRFGSNLKTKGNAWLLPTTKGTEADRKKELSTFIYRNFTTLRVKKKARRSSLARLLVGEQKPSKEDGDALLGGWKEVDVAADAKKILNELDLKSKKGRFFDADQWTYSNNSSQWCARVLVMACQMYRAGHHAEANQMTGRLFSLVPEPIVVIDQVVNHLANTEYEVLVDTFLKSNDWNAYQVGTKELVARFSRGWKSREGAELLITHLDQRIKGVKPELKKLKGVSLKPEAVKIMDDWLVQTKPIVVSPPACWLLGMDLAPTNSYSYDGSPKNEDGQKWMKTLGAMGMDGFIALTAAAADDSLIATTIGLGASNYYGGFSNYSSSSSNLSPAQKQYAAMKRPCSRGEIARKVILQTLPDAENELSALPASELQNVAYQWWLKHRADSPSALAKNFMETGNDGQIRIAVKALIKSNSESDAKMVEAHVLGAENIAQQYSTVEMYLKARRGKAKAFFAAYSKALKDEVGEVDEDDYKNWAIKQAGGVDKYLKKLEIYVNDVSVDKIVADLQSGKLKAKEGIEMLSSIMEAGTFSKHLPSLVAIAREQKDQKELLALLESLYGLSYKESRHFGSENKEKEYYASLPALFEKSKEDWVSLMAQDIPLKEKDSFGGAGTQAEMVAWVIEIIYFPENQGIMRQLQQLVGSEKIWPILEDHVNRVFKDGFDAYFPNPENVKKPARAKIRKDISPLKPQEIGAYYEKLGLDEKLAWSEILDGFGDTVPDGVKKMSTMIMKINWSNAPDVDELIKKKIEKLAKYQVLDEKLVESMVNLMFEHADKTVSFAVMLGSGGGRQLVLNIWGGEQWNQTKLYYLKSALEVMDGGKVKKCAGVTLMNRSESGDTVVRTSPEKDKEKSKEILTKLVKEMLTSIDDEGSSSLLFFSETQENIKKRKAAAAKKAADDEDEDDF